MRDYLVKVTNLAAAKTAIANWLGKDDQGADEWMLPKWCGIFPQRLSDPILLAFTNMGLPPVMSADGLTVITPGVPPTTAAGRWFIISLDVSVNLPPAALAAVQAQGDRDVGLTLPGGIVGLSIIPAGMTLLP